MQKKVKGGTVVGWFEEKPVETPVEEPKTEKPKTTAKKRTTKAKQE